MKYIIEFTEEQMDRLDKERGDLPMPTFIRSMFRFKSVEKVEETQKPKHWLHTIHEFEQEMNQI